MGETLLKGVIMLILTRKSDESIIIGNNIIVKVLRIQGNQVHIGINAPREISVYRREIYEQVMNENRNALRASAKKLSKEKLQENLMKFNSLMGAPAPLPGKTLPAEKEKTVKAPRKAGKK